MSAPLLPRFTDTHADFERKIARILLETGNPMPAATTAGVTLPGDRRRLRGIPVAGGACGTSPGTDPLYAVLRDIR